MNTTITLLTRTEFKKHLQDFTVTTSYYHTAAGNLWVQRTELGIFSAIYPLIPSVPQGGMYRGSESGVKKLILVGTDFQIKVWQAALHIPAGKTVTYCAIAQAIDKPTAHRAVANALGDNNIAYFVPCHRVLRKDGKLGGYRYGVDKKIALLAAERVHEKN